MVELVSLSDPAPRGGESLPPVPEPRMLDENKNTHPPIEMEFSTPLQEVMGADLPTEMPVMDPTIVQKPQTFPGVGRKEKLVAAPPKVKNPFGLTDEQFQAALAGVAGVIAFSKPVQDKIAEMVPQVASGGLTGTAFMLVLTAIIFMLVRRFISPK